jgi:hypothetical protein
MPANRQPTAVVVAQPETSALQLLAEKAILFNQVRQRVLLAPIQPANHRGEHQAERKCVDHGERVYDIDRNPVVPSDRPRRGTLRGQNVLGVAGWKFFHRMNALAEKS